MPDDHELQIAEQDTGGSRSKMLPTSGHDLDSCFAALKKLSDEREAIHAQREELRRKDDEVTSAIKELKRQLNALVDEIGGRKPAKNASKVPSQPKKLQKKKLSNALSQKPTNRDMLINILKEAAQPLTRSELVSKAEQKYAGSCNKFSLETTARSLRRDRDVAFDEASKTFSVVPTHTQGTPRAA